MSKHTLSHERKDSKMDITDSHKSVRGCGFFTTLPQQVGIVSRKGYSINYEIHGRGETRVVCIIGYMASMAGWNPVLDYFLSNGGEKEYSFLVLDNRGVGLSTTGPFERYKTSEMADDVDAVMQHAGWHGHRTAHLVGVSMGGMIALELASKVPERFKSLSLLVTCAKRQPPRGKRWASHRILLRNPFDEEKRMKGTLFLSYSLEQKCFQSCLEMKSG